MPEWLSNLAHFGWINFAGLAIVALIKIPSIIFTYRKEQNEKASTNKDDASSSSKKPAKAVRLLEGIGFYGCVVLMILHLGLYEFGFASSARFGIYFSGTASLLITYWIIWLIYSRGKHKTRFLPILLAIIPILIFMLSGVLLQHNLLVAFTVLFGITHIYVACVSTGSDSNIEE